MLKGITKSGFDYEIEDKALDNWELLESLVAIDEGDTAAFLSGGVFYGSASRQPMQDAALGG